MNHTIHKIICADVDGHLREMAWGLAPDEIREHVVNCERCLGDYRFVSEVLAPFDRFGEEESTRDQ